MGVEVMSNHQKMMALPGVEGVRGRWNGIRKAEINVCHYGAVSRDEDIPTLLTEIDRLKKLLGEEN